MSIVKSQLSNVRLPGFSFIEVVIATFVMLIGMVAVIGLIGKSIIHSADSRDTIIAAELAQEGVELVRNVRDNNIALPAADGAFMYFPKIPAAQTSFECSIDKDYTYPPTTFDCTAPVSYPLYYNASYYSHITAGSSTKFQRKIVVNWDNHPIYDRTTIKSIVIWKGGAFPLTDAECTIGNKCVMTNVILGER